ncbi:MAG: FtsX-like permease family protein [Candidatus Solibacter sp.]
MSSFDYRAGSALRLLAASARIAWRDLRSSPGKFLFAVAAVALGVGSLGGIQGAIAAFQSALSHDLRQWIAADVSVQTAEPPDHRQNALLRSLEGQGIERTVVVDTTAQVTSEATPDPQLVMAKVVDPAKYPFYGRVELSPSSNLDAALRGSSVAVSEDLLARLHVQVGSTIEVNAQRLRISAVIRAEPDRLTLTPTPLPRILLAYPAAESTGLVRPRTSFYLRILFRLPHGTPPNALRHSLEEAFPGRKVLDYLHPDAQAAAILQKLQRSLGAIGVMVLLVGVIAVATSMWSHIEQRLDSIAVMKALGATSGRVIAVYFFQTAYLVCAGCVAGAILGIALERAIVTLTPQLFSLSLDTPWNWRMPLQAAAAGFLAGVFVPVHALLRIRDVRPYLTLRRDMHEDRQSQQPRRGTAYWSAIALAIGAATLLAVSATGSWIEAVLLLLASLAGACAFWAVGSLVLAGCRIVATRRFSLHARHGIANIYRPGNGARPVLVAMGAAVALFSAIHLVQRAAIADVTENFPSTSANLFLLNVEAGDVKGVESLLAAKLGSSHGAVMAPFYSARILDVDGRAIGQTGPETEDAGLRRRWLSARLDRLPPVFKMMEGEWGQVGSEGESVALPALAARALHAKVGSSITFEAGESTFHARLVAIVNTAPLDRFRCCFLFNSKAPGFPAAAWHGVVQVPASKMAELRQSMYRAFPTTSTIDMTESIRLLQEWLNAVLFSVRLVAIFAMIAAAVLLASAVAATRLWRVREIALLKALGATRLQLIRIYSTEFTVLGAGAGVSGSLLAWLAALAGGRLLGSTYPSASVLLVAPVGAIAIANLAGWLAISRLVGKKPLEILRHE